MRGHSRYKIADIIEALVKCNGNKTKAAKHLGISRVHLYRILGHR
jgi:transcriptional regulator of acetoin/glycerol metabolism